MKKISHAIICLLVVCLPSATVGCTRRAYNSWMIQAMSRNVTNDQTVCGDLARIKKWRTTRDLALMKIIEAKDGGNRDRIGHVFLYNLGRASRPSDLAFFEKLGAEPTNFDDDVFTYHAVRVPKGTIFEIEKIIAFEAYNIQHYAYARVLPTMQRVGVEDLFFKNPNGPGPWGSVRPNPDCIKPETTPAR